MQHLRWVLAGATGLLIAWSGLSSQERAIAPAVAIKPPLTSGPRDLGELTPAQRHLYLSAKSAMEWLQRVNRSDGRFVPGFNPALRVPLEGDNYLHQAGAAGALARAASYFQDDRAAALAKQALLTLLLETVVDAKTKARFTAAPDAFLSRLASAGALLAAIHELAQPPADLVQSADQLAQFLRSQHQADGSFAIAADDPKAQAEILQHSTGLALYGIARSHSQRPETWKLAALRKACAYHLAWWRQRKNMPMIPEHTAAYAETYLVTKERAFADCVFEMNDWLCTLQYANLDPRRAHWLGGFQSWADGKSIPSAPTIHSAAAAESLVEACRVAQIAGDAARLQRYRTALDNCLLFLTTLQYTEANTQHFAEGYRHNFLHGGFFSSHQDGNLRLEATHHAAAALVQHLRHNLAGLGIRDAKP